MNRFPIATFVLVLYTTPAFATADVMASFCGQAEIHVHFRADRSFDLVASMMGMSRTSKGSWSADDKENVCRTYVGKVPPYSPNPLCRPLTPHKVGDTWTVALNGATRTPTWKAVIQ